MKDIAKYGSILFGVGVVLGVANYFIADKAVDVLEGMCEEAEKELAQEAQD